MATPIDLVVTDLDGTLWDHRERIHTETLAALAHLEARGVPVLVATGRRLRSAVTTLAGRDLAPPVVVLDGALGMEPDSGRTFQYRAFAPEAAARVLQRFLDHGHEPCVYVDHPEVDVFVGDRPATTPRHLEQIGRWLGRDDLERVVAEHRVLAFGFAGGDAVAAAALAGEVAPDASASATRDLLHGGVSLMARPAGVNKWEGVLAFCADRGLDPDRVLAVGDGENDLELLTAARVSCVVRDGCEAALALADHVIEPAADGGWAAVVEIGGFSGGRASTAP